MTSDDDDNRPTAARDARRRVGATVIVPTHGRPAALARCLAALAAQQPPPGGFEVIVVIDGAEGSTAAVAAAEASSCAPRVVLQKRLGAGAARNRGASLARGRWLAFTDDDCRPAPTWLRALAADVEREPAAIVGGAVRNGLPRNHAAAASQLVQDVAWTHFSRRDAAARFFPSNNMALTRVAFERVDGFDVEWFKAGAAVDRDLCDRALGAGLDLRSVPSALVEHDHDLTPLTLWRQHHRYGRGALTFRRSRARRGGAALAVAPGYYLALARAPRRSARGVDVVRLGALVATTQVAYAAGYAAELISFR